MPGKDLWLQVAQPLDEFRRAQLTAALIAGSTVVRLGIAMSIALAWSIQQELRPIAEFSKAIDHLGTEAGVLEAPRLPRRELISAYSAIEALLGRLRAKLRSEQAFAAHAAHSLRTPLAGLSAQLEVASIAAPAELAPRLTLATEAAHRLAPKPLQLSAMPQITAGPERIEAGWWDTGDLRRDYYVVRTRSGADLWVYRDLTDRSWYLHGFWS